MKPCRIVLTDDHNMFRSGLKSLIDSDSGLTVVAEASNGAELLSCLRSVKCDLVVLDLYMPDMDGILALKEIRRRFPRLKTLILTMHKDPEHFRHAMACGAGGYVLKDDAYDQLVTAVRHVLQDKQFISPSLAKHISSRYVRSFDEADTPSLEILTRREKEVLTLISRGLANKNIAGKLDISIRTVETHRANLSGKLGIKNTAGLVKFAISKGLI